jgi:membrane fusion protein (multidrug efflux system)
VARIYVPEKNLKELKKGQEARVTGRAVSDAPFPGRVERIAPVVDPKSGTVKVTVAVGGQAGLLPGLYVDVALVTAVHDRALLVPKRALVYDHDQVFVYRLGKGRLVERLLIVPGLADADFIEPLQGLSPGDSVVVAGQAGLKHGARVALVSDRASSPGTGGEKAGATP